MIGIHLAQQKRDTLTARASDVLIPHGGCAGTGRAQLWVVASLCQHIRAECVGILVERVLHGERMAQCRLLEYLAAIDIMNTPYVHGYAHGLPRVSGVLRTEPEDFVVDEELGFTPAGHGEHFWLAVRKRGENTAWVAKQLSRLVGCAERDVGYSGLKDRHALTTQWFSLPVPPKATGRVPNWVDLAKKTAAEIVLITRHERKLRRGTHRANRFLLTVRGLDGDLNALGERLELIQRIGVPNWFAEQRFGHDGGNLDAVRAWFASGKTPHRGQQGMLLSTARSELFNAILARRIEDGTWLEPLQGEALMLDGRHSFFIAEPGDESLAERLFTGDVHTSGALWGKEGTQAQGACAELEQAVIAADALLAEGLVREGLEAARRPLRVIPRAMHWHIDEVSRILKVGFDLPSGSYATAVMREVVNNIDSRA
jgi:tRNA pseudouridine13 synthase